MKKIFILLLSVMVVFTFLSCSSESSKLRFKAIYLDMDGTTLTSDYKIRSATLDVLKAFQNCGGFVGIATGRTLPQVKAYIPDIKPDLPLILYNGGLAISPNDNKVLFRAPLDKVVVSKIISELSNDDGIYSIFVHYIDSMLVNKTAPNVEKYIREQKLPEPKVCPELMSCINEMEKSEGELPMKIDLFISSTVTDDVAAKARSIVGDRANVLIADVVSVEIVTAGVDKSVTLKKILQEQEISPSEVVIYGDSGNDRRMLGEFPVTMAMGNCRKETCEAALFKIGNNNTNAIAETIERLVLLPDCRKEATP